MGLRCPALETRWATRYIRDGLRRSEFTLKSGKGWWLTGDSGPNWIDYLTVEFNETETMTYNMAYGGATIDSALVAPWKPTVLSLKDQVKTLFPIASRRASWKPSDSLFLIWIGINDIGNTFSSHPDDADGFQTSLMEVYFGLVNEVSVIDGDGTVEVGGGWMLTETGTAVRCRCQELPLRRRSPDPALAAHRRAGRQRHRARDARISQLQLPPGFPRQDADPEPPERLGESLLQC